MIEELRTERNGAYPPRQIWGITQEGRVSVGVLRMATLRKIIFKPDPFDLALTRLDPDHHDDMPAMIAARLAALRVMLADDESHLTAIKRYLTQAEIHATEHRQVRLRVEIDWHETLLGALPSIIDDERTRLETEPTNE